MKGITRAIGGAGLSISGAILCLLHFSASDSINATLFKFYYKFGYYRFLDCVFLLGAAMIVSGIIFIFIGMFSKDENGYDDF